LSWRSSAATIVAELRHYMTILRVSMPESAWEAAQRCLQWVRRCSSWKGKNGLLIARALVLRYYRFMHNGWREIVT
jgi:hypothetical protein